MLINKEEQLLSAVLKIQGNKDSSAFKFIYDQLSPKLFYVCIRYLKDEDEAKDVLQESFVTVYTKIDNFKGEGSFEGWVRRIVVNNCLGQLKKSKKSNEESINEKYNLIEEPNDPVIDEQTSQGLHNALMQLPEGYRTVINLYIMENYSHKEIAEMLNIEEVSSRTQLSRAKLALKQILTRNGIESRI
jgi:RNA polymerase sigma factor (sigma-70 family)